MAHYEDHNHPRQQGYHGLVLPAGQQGGDKGHYEFLPLFVAYLVMYQCILPHCSNDLVVEEGKEKYWQYTL